MFRFRSETFFFDFSETQFFALDTLGKRKVIGLALGRIKQLREEKRKVNWESIGRGKGKDKGKVKVRGCKKIMGNGGKVKWEGKWSGREVKLEGK